jgi:hypothetical protein
VINSAPSAAALPVDDNFDDDFDVDNVEKDFEYFTSSPSTTEAEEELLKQVLSCIL